MRRFLRDQDFSALSLRDLLDARDHYAVHLANLPNVLGTAVGRYRVRRKDKRSADQVKQTSATGLGPKTLDNSEIKSWSWPSVLVFVSEWLEPEVFAKQPECAVPPLLYMPDGRVVRTCVVLVQRREPNLPSRGLLMNPSSVWGAGSQIHTQSQGSTRLGMASCIVSDGSLTYALASGHVVGTEAGPVFGLRGGKQVVLGEASRCVRDVPLADLYPGFAGKRTLVTLDAGLVRVASVFDWTSQALGVGRLGAPIDLSSDTLSLDLVGCPVFAVVPQDRRIEGMVHALFYRHATMGGFDAVCELLIGPRHAGGRVETQPGDSGVLWFWDHEADPRADRDELPAHQPGVREFRPLAVQWGGQGFITAEQSAEFALTTSLSSICKTLGVEVIRDWSAFQSRYWGKVGHYKVGNAACFLLQSLSARKLFEANVDRIAVSDEDIEAGNLPMQKDAATFIALADVADLYWRKVRKKDDANHFADMDERSERDPFKGKSLLELWQEDPTSRTPAVWTAFYESIDPDMPDKGRGALPFRVAQLYEIMVEAVRTKRLAEYLCAAGLLAHYGGDACQPLHVSHLHHGVAGDKSDDDVHKIYEDVMLTRFAPEVIAGVNARTTPVKKSQLFKGADKAADAVVQLMARTVEALPPQAVLDCFNRHEGNGRTANMWAELGDATLDRLADGAMTLALIWQSAWSEGGGDKSGHIAQDQLAPISKPALKKLYESKEFAKSMWLREM